MKKINVKNSRKSTFRFDFGQNSNQSKSSPTTTTQNTHPTITFLCKVD